ncbi:MULTISPECIES: hypothetical protein [unclassified Clostridium]|uniref:hypothetical protein n=1 Tax=unclassified Clostridium TaxID=2614128 RepID=UPI002079DE9A|nr:MULTISPECIES: hypothetical protein [unclassified Clostridium]
MKKLKEVIVFLFKKDKLSLLGIVASIIIFINSIIKLDITEFCIGCYLLYMNLNNIMLKIKSTTNTLLQERMDLINNRLDTLNDNIDILYKRGDGHYDLIKTIINKLNN